MQTRLWLSLWQGLAESTFGRNLASVMVKIFSYSMHLKRRHQFCSFIVIYKDTAAIKCIMFSTKGKFPSSLKGGMFITRNNFKKYVSPTIYTTIAGGLPC